MKVLEKIEHKSSRDNVTNCIKREDCEIEPVNKWINNRRTKRNEHIFRTEGNRLMRKVRDWIPNGKRNLRKPKMRLKDAVKQED
jgi:hypothetical protein